MVGKLQAATYYSQVTGTQNMSTLSNWNSVAGGGGSTPANFTTSGDVFVIQSTHNIILSASLTLGAGVNLQIAGSFNPAANNLSVGGTTTVTGSGNFTDGFGTGVNTFVGLVTVNTTGVWTTTSISTPSNQVFSGGITNTAGNFNCGACTISGTITPTTAMTFANSIIAPADLTIANGQLVSNTGGTSNIAGDFYIGTGGFTKTATNLTIVGNITTTGPWTSTGITGTLLLNGANITNNSSSPFALSKATFAPSGTNVNLAGSGEFTFSGIVTIASSKTVTNNCSHSNGVTITGTLNGSNASSEWINASGRTLNYSTSSSINAPMITGKLTSIATGSVMNYSRSGSTQNVKAGSYANLKISGGGVKTALGIITVTESFDPSNGTLLTTTANYLLMLDGTTTSVGNASGYVDGPMRYDMALNGTRTLNFPIGKGSDWRPLSVKLSHNTSTSYTYRAESYNASAIALGYSLPPTVDRVSKAHYWDIGRFITGTNTRESSAGLNGNQVITIYYGANDNVQDASNLTICKNLTSTLTTWYDIGGTGATVGSGSITSTSSPTAFNSFTKFTLGNKNGGTNPLPVKLTSFIGSCNDNSVKLEWTTATEINNDFFAIETSKDGQDWNTVGTVKGAGNSSENKYYSFVIPGQITGNNFYRLKQNDFDGKFEYSEIIVVRNCNTVTDKINIFPNPATNSINVSFNGVNQVINSIDIISVTGVKVYSAPFSNEIDLSNITKGIYYIQFNTLDNVITQKLVINK